MENANQPGAHQSIKSNPIKPNPIQSNPPNRRRARDENDEAGIIGDWRMEIGEWRMENGGWRYPGRLGSLRFVRERVEP